MVISKLLCSTLFLIALAGCDAEVAPAPEVTIQSGDEFPVSFRVRNGEIRDDIVAALLEENIAHRVNADGSISYREADGENIDRIFYYAVGLYAARN